MLGAGGRSVLIGLYAYFFWTTQCWTNFNPDYADTYNFEARNVSAGEQVAPGAGTEHGQDLRALGHRRCRRRPDRLQRQPECLDLVDDPLQARPVRHADWDNTPFFDNKASFQRGINQAVRRTATELADNLGRVRGTSQIDPNLQDARGNLQFDEFTWYFGLNPFGPKTPTPSYYRVGDHGSALVQ